MRSVIIRVIKLGKPETEVEKSVNCGRCKSSIGFFSVDTKGDYRYSDSDNGMGCYIDCPVCQNLIYVNITQIEYAWLTIERKQ